MRSDDDIPARSRKSAPTSAAAAAGRTISFPLAGFIDPVWIAFLAGMAVLLLGFLLGPRVPPSEEQATCIGNIDWPGPFGIGLNCDSPQFLWLARDPAGLLEPENARQARPGFIIAAAMLEKPLSLILRPAGPPQAVEAGLNNPAQIEMSFHRDISAYAAYVILNLGILVASFFFLRAILDRWIPRRHASTDAIVVAAGLLLIANDVTKAFVWSAHTQLFNILVPVFAVHAVLRVSEGALFDRRFALATGIALGLGMTAYSVFAVVPLCLLIPGALSILAEPQPRRRWTGLANGALFLALCAAPMLLWYVYVRGVTGSFFHYELAQGEVVWMSESLAKGVDVFLYDWFAKAAELLALAAPQALPVAAFAALVALLGGAAPLRPALPAIVAAIYVSAAILGFYTCVGWIADRLAYPMLPPLMVAAAVAALALMQRTDARGRVYLVAGLIVLTAAQMIFVTVKDGPWS